MSAVCLGRRRFDRQMLPSAQLQTSFVRRVDVENPALFASAAQERDGFGILPQHAAALPWLSHVDDVFEIDRYSCFMYGL